MDRRCSCCGEVGHDRRRCDQIESIIPRTSRSKSFNAWHDLEYYEDRVAQDIVKKNPDGMTLEQVGEVIGVTRERVRQIEVAALNKIQTGEGASEIIELDGFAFAVSYCESCEQPFPRKGRSKICPQCEESGLTIILVEAATDTPSHLREIAARKLASNSDTLSYPKKNRPVQAALDPFQRMEESMIELFSLFDNDSGTPFSWEDEGK